MMTNLETAMKIAEEEDLWIADSGASSHLMGSEEHVFNKKLISGSVRTAKWCSHEDAVRRRHQC